MSAARSRVKLDRLEKTSDGAPVPVNGVYWSLSHKPGYAGGVAAPEPVGIDIEKIREVHAGLFDKIANAAEQAMVDGSRESLFRIWTAKEAVLKAGTAGLRELSQCRLVAVPNEWRMVLSYQGQEFTVEQVSFHGHMAAVTTAGRSVQWCFENK
jgi:4'-phosphopantetheinyl transferase